MLVEGMAEEVQEELDPTQEEEARQPVELEALVPVVA